MNEVRWSGQAVIVCKSCGAWLGVTERMVDEITLNGDFVTICPECLSVTRLIDADEGDGSIRPNLEIVP